MDRGVAIPINIISGRFRHPEGWRVGIFRCFTSQKDGLWVKLRQGWDK